MLPQLLKNQRSEPEHLMNIIELKFSKNHKMAFVLQRQLTLLKSC